MDSKKAEVFVKDLINMGAAKAELPRKYILIRGFMSGSLLGIATVLAFTIAVQSGMFFLGALAFPVGFAMIVISGYELVTGNFAIIPMAVWDRKTTMKKLYYNWFWAYSANLIGSVFFGTLFFIYMTKLGYVQHNAVIDKVIEIGLDKTLAYKSLGVAGLLVAFVKGFLCNWMVSMGVVMGNSSTSTIGRILGLWLPIFMFFTLGLEHSVVNMFVIPTAMMLGAEISFSDWWMWNQIPVTLGNIAGAVIMTGAPLYFTFGKK